MGRNAVKTILGGWTWVMAILITVWWADPVRAIILDFDTDAAGNPIVAGQIIDDEYASFGVTIETINMGGGPNLGVAFDSAHPTGGDFDLATPGATGNAMTRSFHNILIIQENGGDYDGNGIIDVAPDDEGTRPAGSLYFTFDQPITSFGFVLIDVEGFAEITPTSGFFAAFYDGDTMVGQVSFLDFTDPSSSFYDPSVTFGNNSVNEIQPILAGEFGYAAFSKVRISLGGSGAIDDIAYAPIPEPGTVLLLGSGMVGMGAVARRRHPRK